jgi:hypothetical protein
VADRLKLPSLAVRHWIGLSVGTIILIGLLTFVVGQHGVHPQVTRQQAIAAALKYGNGQPYPRVEAKYMHANDLDLAQGGRGLASGDSREFVWVVAVSGHYAISPLGRTTWGIAVVKDEAWTGNVSLFEGGISGNWPPFFDALPDLAKD